VKQLMRHPFVRFGRWVEWAVNRPVKHPKVYRAIYVGGPAAISVLMYSSTFMSITWGRTVLLAGTGVWNFLAWVVQVMFCSLICGLLLTWNRRHRRMVSEVIDHEHIEPMGMEDMGEALEIGTGWRRIRVSLMVTVGHGRVQRAQMHWIEFAVDVSDRSKRPVPLACSDPDVQVVIERNIDITFS
jgi:hypothetical protein